MRSVLLMVSFTFLLAAGAGAQVIPSDSITVNYVPVLFSLTHLHPEETRSVGVSVEGLVHSQSVSLPFSFSLLGNDFIDDELKETTSGKLQAKNVLEDGYEARFYGNWVQRNLLLKEPVMYSVDYSFGGYNSAWFTDELFNTAFYGNAFYAGETADFSGTRSYNFQYDRIGFSAQKEVKGERENWQAGLKLSLMSIHSALRLNMEHATLFTEENGEYLDASYRFEYAVSDTSNHGAFQIDGIGPVIDVMTSWSNKSERTRISVFINNLGMIFWNNKTLTYSADSSIRYEGIQAVNLLTPDDSSLFQYNVDSLLKYTGTAVSTGGTSFPPLLSFATAVNYRLSLNLMLQAGISYRPYPDLLPLIYVKPMWKVGRGVEAGAIASYGGASRYGLGFDLRAKVFEHIFMEAASENILGVFIPKQTTSASLFLRASYQF